MSNRHGDNDHEEQLAMLQGMGFEGNVARRAMEANSWNMNQAISDLTSGVVYEAPATSSSGRRLAADDRGLNSLSVPRRGDSTTRDENVGANREIPPSGGGGTGQRRRHKRSRRRRERESDAGQQSPSSPRQSNRTTTQTTRISQFDVTSETTGSTSPRPVARESTRSNVPESQASE